MNNFDTLSKPTRLTLESHGTMVQTMHPSSDIMADEFAAMIYTVLVGSGFDPATVIEHLSERVGDDN